MDNQPSAITAQETWRKRSLLIGALIGAAVGLGAAHLYTQRWDETNPPDISAGEGVKIGVLVLGLLRSIASL